MTETCIRRPNSVWSKCPCVDCLAENARMAKRVRTGHYARVSNEDAWTVVDGLLARDWTAQAIASAAGLSMSSVSHAIIRRGKGYDVGFTPHHAAAIVRHGEPTAGRVGATGACRRLRGLARQGWGLYQLADVTGVGWTTLAQIRVGKSRRVDVSIDAAIRSAVESIGFTVGGSQQAVAHATRAKWPGLLAWDDIDDPTEATSRRDSASDIDHAVVERMLASGERVRTLTPAEAAEVVRRALARGMSTTAIETLYGLKTDRYVKVRDQEPAA